jgi:hypothetical protein
VEVNIDGSTPSRRRRFGGAVLLKARSFHDSRDEVDVIIPLRHVENDMEKKKAYEPPAITHTEKLEARAVVCAKADLASCPGGPIQT